MHQNALRAAMNGKFSENTISTRLSTLARVERAENVDLDAEFERDEMADLIAKFSYTSNDARANRPNPTKLPITAATLRRDLAAYKSHLNQYRRFRLGGSAEDFVASSDPTNDLEAPDTASVTFGLEADLQAALRENICQLEPGLRIVDNGVERRVPSGFIDILARDQKDQTVVIELKAETARDAVIAQTLGYMADVADEMPGPVRGIIVAGGFRPRVEAAARAIPNLSLKTYSFAFEFT